MAQRILSEVNERRKGCCSEQVWAAARHRSLSAGNRKGRNKIAWRAINWLATQPSSASTSVQYIYIYICLRPAIEKRYRKSKSGERPMRQMFELSCDPTRNRAGQLGRKIQGGRLEAKGNRRSAGRSSCYEARKPGAHFFSKRRRTEETISMACAERFLFCRCEQHATRHVHCTNSETRDCPQPARSHGGALPQFFCAPKNWCLEKFVLNTW